MWVSEIVDWKKSCLSRANLIRFLFEIHLLSIEIFYYICTASSRIMYTHSWCSLSNQLVSIQSIILQQYNITFFSSRKASEIVRWGGKNVIFPFYKKKMILKIILKLDHQRKKDDEKREKSSMCLLTIFKARRK